MKYRILVLAIFAVCLSLAGCAAENEPDTLSPSGDLTAVLPSAEEVSEAEPSIEGNWNSVIDCTDYYNEVMASSEEYEEYREYFVFEDVHFSMDWTFHADGTYTLQANEASVMEMGENLEDFFLKGFTEYLEACIQEAGWDMTVDELIESRGMTMDDIVEGMASAMDLSGSVEASRVEGQYVLEDGKLIMSGSVYEEPDADTHEAYTVEFEGDDLVLVEGGSFDFFESIMPITLKRN